ncbi:MAG: ATP-binding protein [Candidatus Hydrothermarchaeaceae archaeon]
MVKIVGMIFGEVGYGDFNFIVSKESNLQNGQYVKVNHETYGWVLAQVISVSRYNERYSLNAITGASLPKDEASPERTVANARAIGYLDEKGMLKAPRIPFRPGEKVYAADSGIISRSLKFGPKTGIYLGLLDGQPEPMPVYFNVNKLVQKHICVLAKTGAGKSYTVGVLIEELLEKKVPVVIIDPHGEYSALKYPNNNKSELGLMETYGVSPKGFENIAEYTPNINLNPQADRKLSLDITHLSMRDYIDMMPTKMTDSQKGIMFEALKVVKGYGKYSIEDLIKVIHDFDNKAKWNLITSLEMIKESKIFEGAPVRPQDLAKKDLASIINLRGIPPDIQEIVVARLTQDLFDARKGGRIPPTLLLIEEVHNFAPERGFGSSSATGIIRTIASEGRKFGLSLCIVSQRPARVDKSVLSQCNTQIILKVTNPNDMRAISQSIEGFTPNLEEDIMQLQPGVALVVGDVVEQPVFVDVRVKKSRHGGTSVELVRKPREKTAKPMTFNSVWKRIFSKRA